MKLKIKILLIVLLILIISCSKKNMVLSLDNILSSKQLNREMSLLDEMKTKINAKMNEDEEKKFLLDVSNEFAGFKNYFKGLKTNDKELKQIIDSQILLCSSYSGIKEKLNKNKVNVARLYLLDSEKYYQNFVKLVEEYKKTKSL